jgi:hypothetical protein
MSSIIVDRIQISPMNVWALPVEIRCLCSGFGLRLLYVKIMASNEFVM